MSKAISTPIMKKAAVLSIANLGLALAGSVAEPVTSPDADLLEACAAFDVLERAYIAVPGDFWPDTPEERASEAERDRISAAQDPLVERMCELRAVTREGQAARARSLALWDAELMKPGPGDTGTWLTAAIVRDLIGEGGASRPSVMPEVHTRTNAKKVEQQADTRGRLLVNSAELSTWEGVAHG